MENAKGGKGGEARKIKEKEKDGTGGKESDIDREE